MVHSLVPKSGLQHLRNQKHLFKEVLTVHMFMSIISTSYATLINFFIFVVDRSWLLHLLVLSVCSLSLPHSLRSLTHSLTHPRSLTHTHSLTYSLPHLLTPSLTPYSLRYPISATRNVITHENILFQDRSAVCVCVCVSE
jgi:hypothetical protein